MSILIDNVIDNEEIFNILFKKGGYVENKYISSNCNKYTSLIKKNNGLLKSIINNGIIIKNSKMNEIKKINTPLIYFIKSGKIGIVEKLLENGASTEEIDEEGFTPIFHTIKGGRLNLFNILLNKYHANITKKNNNGQTPLIYTLIHFIKNCKYGIVEKLLENGASINEMDEDGFTPLIHLMKTSNTIVFKLLLDKYHPNVNQKNKLENGASINEMDEDGFTPLIHLMKTSNTIVFKLLLDKYHPNVNQKNKLGQTPLSFAQQLDRNKYIYTEIYILLLKNYIKTKLLLALKEGDFKTANDYLNNTKDINVNIYNENKETPIIILIKNEKFMNCDIFKKLIEKGADLSKKFNGEDPLILAIKKKKIEYIQIILKYSSLDINKLYNGKSIMSILIDNVIENEEIFNILFKKGGYIDFTYIMNTRPKLNALIEKNSGLIKSIIQNGLITKKGRNSSIIVNKSPLSFFIKAGKNKLVEKFLENGASVEEIDEEGFTPIFHTIKGVRLNLFNILLNKYHANITRKNKEGLTPLSFAQYYEKKKNINLNQFIKALENKLKQSNNKNNSHSKTNYTDLLINAIKQGNYKKSKNILDNNKKINVNLEDTNHETPLITLFTNKQEENCEILKELIEHG
ncbi:ankyrin repeat-containing domain protein, partial [Neocallimastix sp. 'constans']